MNKIKEKFLFCEKYAPETVEELILPRRIKSSVQSIIDSGKVPNLLLSGQPGCGKTQTIKVICKALDAHVLMVNGSDEGRHLDFIRNTVQSFAAAPSLKKKHKVIIFDEFDNTTKDVQLLLRGMIEKYQSICSFCLTCNYLNKVEPAIQSRTTPIEFTFENKEKKGIAVKFFNKLTNILKTEGIKYDKQILIQLVVKEFGNWRHIINICQGYSGSEIDVGILGAINEDDYKTLFEYLKGKNFDKMRQWVAEHVSNSPTTLVRELYDKMELYIEKASLPIALLLLAECDLNLSMNTDPIIQIQATLTKLMGQCNYK